jgi:death on curing protein
LATVVSLDLDGSEPDPTDDAAFHLVIDVAAGAADVQEIADRLRVAPR